MGLYRSVFCQMACEHCGKEHRADVQFLTGHDQCEEYESGQTIPPKEGLVPGQSYEGYVDRFCPDCHRKWHAEHVAAMYQALARYVAEGRLVNWPRGATAASTAEQLSAEGDRARNTILDSASADSARIVGPVFEKIIWDGEALDLMTSDKEATTGFSQTFRGDVTEALEAAGWPLGRDSIRIDLRVCIGDDMKIFARDAEGVVIP